MKPSEGGGGGGRGRGGEGGRYTQEPACKKLLV